MPDKAAKKIRAVYRRVRQALTEFILVDEKGFAADIVLGPKATTVETHAAQELASYVEQMTGTALRIVVDPEPAAPSAVLIGRPETNPVIASLALRKKIEISSDKPGLDGFVIKTLNDGGKSYLVLSGSMDSSSLYAVYDFLERFCHTGFFWDHERIPKNGSLKFNDIDISSRPYFEDRQYYQCCAFTYSTRFWGWQDWKQEIDWMAKKKLNVLFVCGGWEVAHHEALKALGVEPPRLSFEEAPELMFWAQFREAEAVQTRQIIAYAHSLGIRTTTPGTGGEVPKHFRKVYPDARYIALESVDGSSTWTFLHPSDPLFFRAVREWNSNFDRIFGTSNLYNADVYCGMGRDYTFEERTQLNVDYAKSMTAVIKSISPDGKWVMSGWGFTDRNYWSGELLQAFFAAIPKGMALINNVGGEKIAGSYRALNYFYGHNWGYTVLHADTGGCTHLHGDLRRLIRDSQDIITDPQARNCRAFYISPAILRHNSFFYDLAARLSWNPGDVTLEQYIRDYALCRYGQQGADGMSKCLKELTKTAYSATCRNNKPYQFSATELLNPEQFESRAEGLSSLGKALDIALSESAQQVNTCYDRDIVDFSREYLARLFTGSYLDFMKAYKAGDRSGFDATAVRMRRIMDALEQIVALCPEYHIAEEINRAVIAPYNLSPHDAAVYIRGRYTQGNFNAYPNLLDCARRDMAELLKYYYRQRVELLIGHLKQCLKTSSEPSEEYLFNESKRICKEFIFQSPTVLVPEIPAREVAEVIREIIAGLDTAE